VPTNQFRDLHVAWVPPSTLRPNPRNPRKHTRRQIRKMVHILRHTGFVDPIIVDETNTILAGHLRYAAAPELGMVEVPVVYVHDMTPAQKRAYIIASNRIAEESEWDAELLAFEFQALLEIDPGFDLTLTGFDMGEIDLLIREEDGSATEASDADPAAFMTGGPPITQLGDLWTLGEHRLLCGDATSPNVIALLMGGKHAQMVMTDPPYNVPIQGHVSGSGRHDEFAMASGEMSEAEFTTFLITALGGLAAHTTDGAVLFVFMDWRHLLHLLAAGRKVGLDLLNLCVWAKTNAGMGSLYRSQHELVAVFKNGSAPHINNVALGRNGRNRTNVWTYPGMNSFGAGRDEALALHPTVKPVALVEDAILDCSHRNGIILDPFVGSGTTLIAAERTGRRAFGLELDPRYVDVALRRFRKATGIDPVHAASGRTLTDLESRPRLAGQYE
jgi:DNA modification methylase